MPVDTFAKGLAVELTGRSKWSEKRGSEAFAGKHRVELLCDLLFTPRELQSKQLITIENRPFKRLVGFDDQRKFFSFDELAQNAELQGIIRSYFQDRSADPDFRPSDDQTIAMKISGAMDMMVEFMNGRGLAIVPTPDSKTFLEVGAFSAEPGAESVLDEFQAFGRAYAAGEPLDGPAAALRAAIDQVGTPDAAISRAVGQEVFYNNHNPWLRTAILYGLAIVALGLSSVFFRRTLFSIGIALVLWGTVEQVLGLSLRVIILGRAPVSNTYEALIWMGLVAIVIGGIAQLLNRKGWYIFGATIAAELSVLFAMLVPLQDQTNTLPAVLRSNYWLIIHVLTIVASYGVLMLAAVLAHVYLLKQLFLRKAEKLPAGRSHPAVVQTYRAIQLGVLLLTVGTILGGVWAADSWGRFWGWDPKETWALISIVVYFTMLHARHIGWLKDFGLAVSAIVGFMAIVWTFYGVNYVMAAGLHSYGFGAGGEKWVALWAIIEIAFLGICKWRQVRLAPASPDSDASPIKADDAPKSPPASSPA